MKKQKVSNLRIGIYARRTVDSDKSSSIQMQIETCRKKIEMTFPDPGQVASVTIYQDEGFTRRNTDRPDWQRMNRDIEAGLLDVIVAYKIDRVSGNMKDFAIFYSRIVHEHDLRLICCHEGVDSNLPLTGEFMAYLSALMASYEVQQDSIRSFDNSRNLAIHGYWFGGKPPVGYSIIPVSVDGKNHKMLELYPEDIEYKMNLVNIFLKHDFSLSAMEGYLKRNGIKTKNGKFFSTIQIHALLTSPQCVEATPEMYDYFAEMGCEMENEHSPREKWDGSRGIIIFGRTTEQKGKHVQNPPDQWLVCLGLHKPFMKAETYLQIRSKLARHVFDKTSIHPPTLLKGILRCKCGNLMHITRKKKVDGSYSTWYYCLTRSRKGTEYCDAQSIRTEILDERILDVFREINTDPAAITKYVQSNIRISKESSSSYRMKERNTQEKIERLAASLANNANSSAAKYIIAEIERLDKELEEYKRKALLAASEERKTSAALQDAMKKQDMICRLIDNFDSFSAEHKNCIAKSVLKECSWDGCTLKITL